MENVNNVTKEASNNNNEAGGSSHNNAGDEINMKYKVELTKPHYDMHGTKIIIMPVNKKEMKLVIKKLYKINDSAKAWGMSMKFGTPDPLIFIRTDAPQWQIRLILAHEVAHHNDKYRNGRKFAKLYRSELYARVRAAIHEPIPWLTFVGLKSLEIIGKRMGWHGQRLIHFVITKMAPVKDQMRVGRLGPFKNAIAMQQQCNSNSNATAMQTAL